MRKKEFFAIVENARVNDPAYSIYARDVHNALFNKRLLRVELAPAGSLVPGVPIPAGRAGVWKDVIVDIAENIVFPNQRPGDIDEAIRGIRFITLNRNDSFYTGDFFEGYTGIECNDEWGYRFMHFFPNTFFDCWHIAECFREKELKPIFHNWVSTWINYLDKKVRAKGGNHIDYIRPRKYTFNCAPLPYLFTFLPPKMTRRQLDDYRKMDYDLANTIERLIKKRIINFPTIN
jgi:hypothetical protein